MITHTRSILAVGALAALSTLTTSAATRYVWLDSPGPSPPYTYWATRRHIQDAVHATGGRAVFAHRRRDRVAVDKPLTVRSVNGPPVRASSAATRCLARSTAMARSGACI